MKLVSDLSAFDEVVRTQKCLDDRKSLAAVAITLFCQFAGSVNIWKRSRSWVHSEGCKHSVLKGHMFRCLPCILTTTAASVAIVFTSSSFPFTPQVLDVFLLHGDGDLQGALW